MTKLEINVQEPYFSLIKDGSKTVEGRLGKDKFKNLKIGDCLGINGEIEKTIVNIVQYNSFEEMLVMEGVKNTIPDATSLNEAVNAYYKFYTKKEEEELGVIAIKLK